MALHPGLRHQLTITVQPEQTALAVGSGDVPVFGTPMLLAAMEAAALKAVAAELAQGMTTVGTLVEMKHLAPTPVGAQVRIEAELIGVDGRQLSFEILAFAGDTLVGKARHQRVMVDRERFIAAATS